MHCSSSPAWFVQQSDALSWALSAWVNFIALLEIIAPTLHKVFPNKYSLLRKTFVLTLCARFTNVFQPILSPLVIRSSASSLCFSLNIEHSVFPVRLGLPLHLTTPSPLSSNSSNANCSPNTGGSNACMNWHLVLHKLVSIWKGEPLFILRQLLIRLSRWGGGGEWRLFKHSSGHFSPLQHCSGLGENWPLVNLIFFPRSHFQVLQTAASSSSMKEGVAHVAHFTFLRFLLTIAKLLLLLALLLTNTNLSRGR